MGEPLAMLPPSVPELRTASPAKRAANVASCGHSAASAWYESCKVTDAPTTS